MIFPGGTSASNQHISGVDILIFLNFIAKAKLIKANEDYYAVIRNKISVLSIAYIVLDFIFSSSLLTFKIKRSDGMSCKWAFSFSRHLPHILHFALILSSLQSSFGHLLFARVLEV